MNPSKQFPESSRWGKVVGGASSSFASQMTIFLCLTNGASLGYTSAAAKTEICHFLMKVWGAPKVLHLAEAEEGRRRRNEGGRLAVSEKEEGQEREVREQGRKERNRGREREREKDDRISFMK